MLKPVLITPPAADVVSLDDAKAHLHVASAGDDSLITALILAATVYLDGYAGILSRCLINQGWRQDFGCIDWCLRLPFPDVSGAAVSYYDASNAQQTVNPANYQVLEDGRGAFVQFVTGYGWPSTYWRPDAVSVTLTAGYGAAAAKVPGPLRSAILLHVGSLYSFAKSDAFIERDSVEGVGYQSWGMIADASGALNVAYNALVAPYRRVGL